MRSLTLLLLLFISIGGGSSASAACFDGDISMGVSGKRVLIIKGFFVAKAAAQAITAWLAHVPYTALNGIGEAVDSIKCADTDLLCLKVFPTYEINALVADPAKKIQSNYFASYILGIVNSGLDLTSALFLFSGGDGDVILTGIGIAGEFICGLIGFALTLEAQHLLKSSQSTMLGYMENAQLANITSPAGLPLAYTILHSVPQSDTQNAVASTSVSFSAIFVGAALVMWGVE